ncbi:MAG: hypothetical protein JWQ74_1047 [Marmoricola sp.]|nr:hypothetical protein [Marmoricola sp.]
MGHSLRGRAALLNAAYARVQAAVALNPYLQSQDRYIDLSGTDVLVVHGTAGAIGLQPPERSMCDPCSR